jgi:hypothetical protein
MKPGFRTTEFWVTTCACLVGLLISSGAFEETGMVMRGLGLAAAALTSAGYSVSRGMAKKL